MKSKELSTDYKNNKSPGCDNILSEFIKGCSKSILPDLCNLFNYMIKRREFPEIWAEWIRSAIYKSGVKLDPANYRGITVLPVFAKIFEIAIYDLLIFVNEAFGILDKFNGGFLKGCRTADNILILKTLIQQQLLKGENCLCALSISRKLSIELIGIFYSISYSNRACTGASLKPYTIYIKRPISDQKSRESLSRVYSTVLG